MNKFERSRRQFLRTASMASMAGLYASPFLMELNSVAAMAQSSGASDYRALVCVFLQGGNDGHGTVIATDSESYSAFTQARSGAPGLAYPMSQLLPIVPKTSQSGRTFAFNPSLIGLQNLFNAGRAAVVANVGTLIAPATKTQVMKQFCSSSRFPLFALRSNRRMAGHRFERRKRRARRLGRICSRSNREHGHELEFHVHLHLHFRNCALPLRPVVLSTECHLRRPDSDCWNG